jgi:hypothetical protein
MSFPEDEESLWSLVAAPLVWLAHFLASYVTAAIWCAKLAGADGSLSPVRIAIAAYTIVALLAVGVIGWRGFRRYRAAGSGTPHHADTAAARHRFLGFIAMLLSVLSAVAILYDVLVPIMIGSCR